MLVHNTYQVSDENYKDSIHTSPSYYNAMRVKPTNPVALIEQNMPSMRTFPHINTNMQSREEWRYFRDEKAFRKRCLFNYDQNNMRIHVASLDSLTNNHLREPKLQLPHEDDVYRKIGQKKSFKQIDKRNGLNVKSKGDKSYRAPEYSNEYFSKKNRNWRTEYFGITKRSEEPLPDELMEMLSNTQRNTLSSIFSNRFDYGYEQDPRIEKAEEISVVKDLDNWQTPIPLEKAFKVLDLTDKNMKYRPRVR